MCNIKHCVCLCVGRILCRPTFYAPPIDQSRESCRRSVVTPAPLWSSSSAPREHSMVRISRSPCGELISTVPVCRPSCRQLTRTGSLQNLAVAEGPEKLLPKLSQNMILQTLKCIHFIQRLPCLSLQLSTRGTPRLADRDHSYTQGSSLPDDCVA